MAKEKFKITTYPMNEISLKLYIDTIRYITLILK